MKQLDPAFQILSAHARDPGQNLKLALNRVLDTLAAQNRPRVSRLVYGVIRCQNTLDHFLAGRSRIPPDRISPDTRVWLRMGLFLLAFSRSFPDHAVVNEIVKRSSPGARGYVNAMLRNLARDREAIQKEAGRLDDPAIKYSISQTLISGLAKISDRLIRDLEYLNREPLFHLRANTWVISPSRLEATLKEEGVPFRKSAGLGCFEIKKSGPVIRRIVERGSGYFQNTGSQLVSLIAAGQARKGVLDGCAAPGTKSVTLKQANPGLTVVAGDLRLNRMRLIRQFRGWADRERLWAAVSDLRRPGLKDRFDLVLLDAPCTSSGTLRKNPDLKLKITPDQIREQAREQLKMLESVSESFPSADILYSVCSFIPGETEGVMERFAPEKRGYRIRDLSPVLESRGFRYRRGCRGCYLLPDDTLNNDLFYLALMTPGAVHSASNSRSSG